MILAPAAMANEPDPKKAAQKCFDEVGLDPDMYRIGHTKASCILERNEFFSLRFSPSLFLVVEFFSFFRPSFHNLDNKIDFIQSTPS